MKATASAIAALALVLLAHTPAAGAQGDQATADLWKSKCASCHGADGHANTAMGKKMKVRPVSSPEVQNMTDTELYAITAKGKGKMPGYEGKLTSDQMHAMVAHMRSLGGKGASKSSASAGIGAGAPSQLARADSASGASGTAAGPPAESCAAMMEQRQKMMSEMQQMDAQLQQAVSRIDSSTGEAKIDAMAQAIRTMAEQRKTMHEKMQTMHSQMMQHAGMHGGRNNTMADCPMMQHSPAKH